MVGIRMEWTREKIEELCESAQDRINSTTAKSLMARHAREEPPNDPRHLTDTRTRVSTLLEYSLAYELNDLLMERSDGQFISCVLWNVFPDLVIRNSAGDTIAGLEVKALHTAAEEKSANLATPVSRINASTDYLVVMIWGWERSDEDGREMRFPRIYFSEVFNAHAIARIRDYTWLSNQNDRIKGVDLATPIISQVNSEDQFKAEEGNLGKLMRIKLTPNASTSLKGYSDLRTEGDRLERFQNRILGSALIEVFKEVCYGLGVSDISHTETADYPQQSTLLASGRTKTEERLQLYAGRTDQRSLPTEPDGTVVLWLGRKLDWRVFKRQRGQWEMLGSGLKAETAISQIDGLIWPAIQNH
jgi:hypothetical protein